MSINDLEERLEAQIDRHGIQKVMEALAQVCFAKGDHVRSAWIDNELARNWDLAGTAIARLRIPDIE